MPNWQESLHLVEEWVGQVSANLHQLRVLLDNLSHMAQCCEPARLFLNRMLVMLRGCPISGEVRLDTKLRKDINWFC